MLAAGAVYWLFDRRKRTAQGDGAQ
jgi:hypothetical protein